MDEVFNNSSVFEPSEEAFPLDGRRYNPLDNFKRYNGGYSVDNKDYWASLTFLGIWGFAIAALILVVGIIWIFANCIRLGCRCCCGRCCSSEDSENSENKVDKEASLIKDRQPKWVAILNLIVSVAAIAGSAITISGAVRMIDAVDDTTDVMVITVDDLAANATIVFDAVVNSYDLLEGIVNNNSEIFFDPDLVENAQRAEQEASDYVEDIEDIRIVVKDNDDDLRDIYDDVQLGFVIMSAVIAAVVIFGTILMLLYPRIYNKYFSQVFIPVAVFLSIVSWISFGIVLVLLHFEDDSCGAFEEWNHGWLEDFSPEGDLTDIIPCPENDTIASIFSTIDQLIYDTISVANMGIEYLETENGIDLSNFYVCYPDLSDNVQPPPGLNMPDTCQEISNSTSMLNETCTDLPADVCEEVQSFFESVLSGLIIILNAIFTAREILFVAVSCEFVFVLFSWFVDVQCQADDNDSLEGATTLTLIGLGLLSSALLLASLLWIIVRNRTVRSKEKTIGKVEISSSRVFEMKTAGKKF